MKKLVYTSLLSFLVSIGMAQSHYFGLNGLAHINQEEFYVGPQAQESGVNISPAGDIKFSAGLEYSYSFADDNTWFLQSRAEYAYRSYTTVITVLEAPLNGYAYKAEYIDILIGGGKMFEVNRLFNLGFSVLPGVGLPLLEENTPTNSPLRPSSYNLDRVLPFVEVDLICNLMYVRKRNHAWSVGIAPFVRAYLNPLYDPAPGEADRPPYFGYGAVLKLGYHMF